MSLPQQKFREIVFQILYCQDFGCTDEEAIGQLLMPLLSVTKKSIKTAALRAASVSEHLAEIDAIIAQNSRSYSFERISRVEKNVLRLGLYELLYDQEMPKKAAIAEAIRICRKFGTRESANYVNAILDAIYKETAEGQASSATELPKEPVLT